MKKQIKIAVVVTIGLLSGTVAAAQFKEQQAGITDSVCKAAPMFCTVSILGNGDGKKPPKPGTPPPTDK